MLYLKKMFVGTIFVKRFGTILTTYFCTNTAHEQLQITYCGR
jgi:hypothetical protein